MQFKSLKSRIAVVFLTLILLIQIVGSIAIKLSIEKNARASVNEQLQIGERIFRSLLEQNGENLSQGARILATDYGFRQAIASNDYETVLSALSNHQSRIGADIAIFYAPGRDSLTISGSLPEDVARGKVSALIKSAQNNGDTRDFVVFKNQPYQLVAVPVKAPLTIGWIVMGFKINNELAQKLNKLSNLEVTFISKSNDSHWSSMASTLNMASSEELVAISAEKISKKSSSDHPDNSEIDIGKTDYGTRYVAIFDTPDQALFAVLQRSIDEATAPYKTLQLNLLILTIIGALVFIAGIFYISKRITMPITELAETAKQLEAGNYDIMVHSDRKDELGKLGNAFNSMSEAIASREKSILKLAYWDEMTQLPNRASFMLQLGQAMAVAKEKNESLSVLVMDLDRFKQINNILGQSSGDELLHAVAERISSSTRRKSDVVARFGGDEFAVLLPTANIAIGLSVASALIKTLETPIQVNDQFVDITAGLGIATYPDHAENEEQLLSRAEMAMYKSKASNSGAIVFEPAFDISSQDNLSLSSELKSAISNKELALYIQPKIDLITRKVCSTEALIRWKHPKKGLVFPDEFIPFAEHTGLIRSISLLMLSEAAALSATWRDHGIYIPIAVNISARDLIDHDLPNKLNNILNTHHVDTSAISLEITESSIMDDPLRAQQTLDNLSQMGVKLAIDDFGTGYSSLSYLKRLPVSELKIDKSFVLKMEEDDSDSKIVRSTIDLGHNLGLKVVAEGIENEKVWDLLKEMGCDYGQGYFMSKPMPAQDFLVWMSRWDDSGTQQVKSIAKRIPKKRLS
ncbi:MAG TPA: EAL domain-containing protein [Methylophilaceae bacterium]|nr:EAL domain-containing protein [Methylophilaceae bacterium]